jgi:hypothetical protein
LRDAYGIVMGRAEGNRPLGRPRHGWQDNTKLDFKEVGWQDMFLSG